MKTKINIYLVLLTSLLFVHMIIDLFLQCHNQSTSSFISEDFYVDLVAAMKCIFLVLYLIFTKDLRCSNMGFIFGMILLVIGILMYSKSFSETSFAEMCKIKHKGEVPTNSLFQYKAMIVIIIGLYVCARPTFSVTAFTMLWILSYMIRIIGSF